MATSMSRGPNEHLIGTDARKALCTPALLLEREAFERNLTALEGAARRHGKRVRPHVKAHKCTTVGRRQVEAGAIGLCCATVRELERMAAAGLSGLLLTSPVSSPGMIERLRRVQPQAPDFAVVADNAEILRSLAQAFTAERPLGIVIEIDVGQGRTGVTSPEAAVRLSRLTAELPQLCYRGVQAYYGHLQHVRTYADRKSKVVEQWGRLRPVLDALRGAGHPPEIVTGGGTGTHHLDLTEGPFTEIQPGSYVFMDKEYGEIEMAPGGAAPFLVSLSIASRVISANQPGLAVIDAGYKAMATDAGPALVAAGAPAEATYEFMGDEHGGIRTTSPPALGALVILTAPHCDPTVNLHDRFHVMEGDRLVDIWPIDARGY